MLEIKPEASIETEFLLFIKIQIQSSKCRTICRDWLFPDIDFPSVRYYRPTVCKSVSAGGNREIHMRLSTLSDYVNREIDSRDVSASSPALISKVLPSSTTDAFSGFRDLTIYWNGIKLALGLHTTQLFCSLSGRRRLMSHMPPSKVLIPEYGVPRRWNLESRSGEGYI